MVPCLSQKVVPPKSELRLPPKSPMVLCLSPTVVLPKSEPHLPLDSYHRHMAPQVSEAPDLPATRTAQESAGPE